MLSKGRGDGKTKTQSWEHGQVPWEQPRILNSKEELKVAPKDPPAGSPEAPRLLSDGLSECLITRLILSDELTGWLSPRFTDNGPAGEMFPLSVFFLFDSGQALETPTKSLLPHPQWILVEGCLVDEVFLALNKNFQKLLEPVHQLCPLVILGTSLRPSVRG